MGRGGGGGPPKKGGRVRPDLGKLPHTRGFPQKGGGPSPPFWGPPPPPLPIGAVLYT